MWPRPVFDWLHVATSKSKELNYLRPVVLNMEVSMRANMNQPFIKISSIADLEKLQAVSVRQRHSAKQFKTEKIFHNLSQQYKPFTSPFQRHRLFSFKQLCLRCHRPYRNFSQFRINYNSIYTSRIQHTAARQTREAWWWCCTVCT